MSETRTSAPFPLGHGAHHLKRAKSPACRAGAEGETIGVFPVPDEDETVYLSRYDGSYCAFVYQGEVYSPTGRHVGTLLFSRRIVAPNGDYLGERRGNRVLIQSTLKGSKLAGS